MERTLKQKSKDSKSIFKEIRKMGLNYYQENWIVFYMNRENKCTCSEILFLGGEDYMPSDFKIIFKRALEEDAINLIVAHNHTYTPTREYLKHSDEDMKSLKLLVLGAGIFRIGILESMVFNDKNFLSIYPNSNRKIKKSISEIGKIIEGDKV